MPTDTLKANGLHSFGTDITQPPLSFAESITATHPPTLHPPPIQFHRIKVHGLACLARPHFDMPWAVAVLGPLFFLIAVGPLPVGRLLGHGHGTIGTLNSQAVPWKMQASRSCSGKRHNRSYGVSDST